MKRFFFLFLCLSSCLLSQALGTDSLVCLNDDGSIDIRIHAPHARKVKLDASFLPKPVRMKHEGGYWAYHLDSLPPEIYTYRFLIDKQPYPNAPASDVMRDVEKYYRFFIVSGDTVRYLEHRSDISHGNLRYVWYYSTLNGMSQRRMAIYLPPGYDESEESRYPVLYLLHGSGGDETSWSDCGRVCQIVDNLIAAKKIDPLIVVMPNGNIKLDAAPGESPWMEKQPSAMNLASMTGSFEKSFRKEIVDYVDKHYRTLDDKQHRAIAGLSMGGLHVIYTSVNNPDLFDYVGLFSAQATNMIDDRKLLMISRARRNHNRFRQAWGMIFNFKPSESVFDEKLSDVDTYSNFDEKLDRQFSTPPRLYFIAIGDEDRLVSFNNDLRAHLDAKGYAYEYQLSSGSHSWENWRRYLIEFLLRMRAKN